MLAARHMRRLAIPHQLICQFISGFVHRGTEGAVVLTPLSAQCHSQCWGPRFSFPDCWQRETLGDLTSLLSKNNGCAFGGTDRMLENGTLRKRLLFKKKESHQIYMLTHQSWHQLVGALCPREHHLSMSPGRAASSMWCQWACYWMKHWLQKRMLAGTFPGPWQHLLLAGLCGLRTDTAHHG